MESILAAAEEVLLHSGLPALRLSRLLREVKAVTGSGARGLTAPRLRALLEHQPHRFRVLDPWRGPWRFVRPSGQESEEGEPWVVAVRDHGARPGPDEGVPPVVRQVQESVRWLALTLDPASTRSVVRWRGLLLEALEANKGLRKAA